jgi:hypothetical protein
MFKALEIGSTIDLEPQMLVALERSANTQQLALGGGPRKPTRAYILGFLNSAASTYCVYVFLGRLERGRDGQPQGLLFLCDPPNVTVDGYEPLQREAMTMVQSQGFQMQGVTVTTLSDAERLAALHDLPFLAQPASPPPPLGTADAGSASLQSTHRAARIPQVSREISLPEIRAVQTLGKLLTLF